MRRLAYGALLCAHGALPSALLAQAHAEPGVTSAGLSGIDRIHLPRARGPAVALAASAGYGFTESQGAVGGAHHRAAGALGVGAAISDFFGFALRFDGRHDVHPDDGMGTDAGTVGDPRLFARAGAALGDRVQLGGEAVLWLPGQNAPSLELGASSLDLRATLAHAAPESAWTFAGSLGYRLDHSAKAAPDVSRLRAGDRLALGLSDFDALLIALGAVHRRGALELLSEASIDLLVGSGAPAAGESPLRVAFGARYHVGALQFALLAAVSPSARPSQAPGDRLVPIEPRLSLQTGLSFRFGGAPSQAREPEGELVQPAREPAVVAAPAVAAVRGRLLDRDGEPVAGARVRLQAGARELETESDALGGYVFEAVPVGTAAFSAERAGHAPLAWTVQISAGRSELSDQVLPAAPAGQLRGLALSFRGRPVAAKIRVRVLGEGGGDDLELRAGADGRFQLDLPPGRYEVIVSAPGFEAQVRIVELADEQVLILNLDLRKAAE